MAELAIQRTYRAPCPGCGAPVEFRSAQSTHAVCAYCKSTVVRDGDRLTRIGKMADVFDDYSPLQLFATGRWQNRAFTVVGRLQYKYGDTSWNEWQLAFDDGGPSAELSEDNGAFVYSTPVDAKVAVPEAGYFRVGATTAVNGKSYSVASSENVSLAAAQGELGHLPAPGEAFPMVELRSADGEVLSIDYGRTPPTLSVGRAVALEELDLKGLKEASTREDQGRAFNCPNCGAPVEVKLGTSKTCTCPNCHAIIDLTQGVGKELAQAERGEPIRSLIPLGAMGKLQGQAWQVVGFQHRMGSEPGDDEQFGWSEYLLFNSKRGFTFLVDADDGWSVVKPTTGAPQMASNEQSATYLGTRYQLQYAYNAETVYVAGEFYWPVSRGQKTFNRDFAAGRSLLSMEQTPREITWSSGNRVDAALIAAAFGLDARKELFKRDAGPVSITSTLSIATVVLLLVLVLIMLLMVRSCTAPACDPRVQNCSGGSTGGTGFRSSGGSFGGYSSGGSHK